MEAGFLDVCFKPDGGVSKIEVTPKTPVRIKNPSRRTLVIVVSEFLQGNLLRKPLRKPSHMAIPPGDSLQLGAPRGCYAVVSLAPILDGSRGGFVSIKDSEDLAQDLGLPSLPGLGKGRRSRRRQR